MASTIVSQYLRRSAQVFRDGTVSVLKMSGASEPSRASKHLYGLRTRSEIAQFTIGSDADIGGSSTVNLQLDEERGGAKFWGTIAASIRRSKGGEGSLGGYVGMRSKRRPTLFGEVLSDISNHEFLALRVRAAGDENTRNSYFVNLQTDQVAQSTEIWQHRLFFPKGDGSWEDVFIPFSKFICTNAGNVVNDMGGQMELQKDRLRTVGISLLADSPLQGTGNFELGLEEIWAVNWEDIKASDQIVTAGASIANGKEPSVPEKSP